MSKKYKGSQKQAVQENIPVAVEVPLSDVTKVRMVFSQPKYYNDPKKALFDNGKSYELHGDDWIQRWEKRGGLIVDGTSEYPEADQIGPSTIEFPSGLASKVESKITKPLDSDNEEKVEETISHEEPSEGEEAKEDVDNF